MEKTSRKQAIITIAVVAVTIFAVFGAILLTKKKSNKNLANATGTANNTNASQNTSSDQAATDNPASNTPQTSTSTFKDGTYKATGSYTSPGGNEEITVSVTLKDGVVTDTNATSGANDPTAEQYQGEFIAGYKDKVVGKKISAIKLSRVSGSSLTSEGFNSAIQKIQQQAKA